MTRREEAALAQDEVLQVLVRQLGPAVLESRLADARRREQVVLAVEAAMAGGESRPQACARVAPEVSPATIDAWRRRRAAEGLPGLVDRRFIRTTRGGEDAATKPAQRGPQENGGHSFLRWVGSKRRLTAELLQRMPPRFGTYFEPMIGSGALFLALRPPRAVLGDLNPELVHAWSIVQQQPAALLEAIGRHPNTSARFHEVRAQRPEALPEVERAARFVYLNQACFNGLYRVNRHGHFNVPYGRRPKEVLRDDLAVGRAHAALQGATLRLGSYEEVCREARRGDLVYLDPPYLTAGASRRIRYDASAFGEAEHEALAAFAHELDRRGCYVLMSQGEAPLIHRLYSDFHLEERVVHRSVGGTGLRRGGATELLLRNYPKLPA